MSTTPSVSVIVPVRNGAAFVPAFCAAMQKQDCPDFELIVVDNGSTDQTLLLLRNQLSLRIRIIEWAEAASSYGARNAGVQSANAEILAFTDIDCLPSSDWISAIIANRKRLEQNQILAGEIFLFTPSGIECRFDELASISECAEIQRGIWTPVSAYDRRVHLDQKKYVQCAVAATANLIMSRQLFLQCGGFRSAVSGEDHRFCQRAPKQGGIVVYDESLLVFHPLRTSICNLLRKEWRIGKGKGQEFASSSVCRFVFGVTKTFLALLLQPMQLRIILHEFIAGRLKYVQVMALAVVAVQCGFVGRCSVLVNAVIFFVCGEKND